jgi:(2Fe-2S) ferredoxin
MVVISQFRADIVPGDFLIARKAGLQSSSHVVCRVQRPLDNEQLEIVWWEKGEASPPLCPVMYENLHRCKVEELFEGEGCIIHHSDVIDVAFVFSPDFLEQFWVDIAGMTNVFLTRVDNHVCFSAAVLESYPHRIWYSILAVQDKVKKLLSGRRQLQLCQKSSTISMSLEGWWYIVWRLKSCLLPISYSKRKTSVLSYSDLSMVSKSTIRNYAMIRIVSPASLSAARLVFGQTFGIGSRNHPPRKGAPRKVLEVGNVINFVNPSADLMERRFAEFITSERIDMVYEEFTRTLSIRVKYSSVLAEDCRVSEVLKFAPQPIRNVERNLRGSRSLRRVRALAEGTTFVLNNKVFRVTSSIGEVVTAISAVDDEEINLSINEAWQIIRNNIG